MEQVGIIVIQSLILLCLPWFIYKLFYKGKKSFTNWMGLQDTALFEKVFVVICLLLIFLFRTFVFISYILVIYSIVILKNQMINENAVIRNRKSNLYAFIAVFIAFVGIQYFFKYYYSGITYIILWGQPFIIQKFAVTMTIFLGVFFRISYKDFNWNITLSMFLSIVVIYIFAGVMPYLIDDSMIWSEISIVGYFKSFLQHIYYPGIVEEVIFRGFMLGGLLAFGLGEDRSNIFQAIVFGLIHVMKYDGVSLITITYILPQIFLGYILGKIYLRTKSLTPCILLHAFLDTL